MLFHFPLNVFIARFFFRQKLQLHESCSEIIQYVEDKLKQRHCWYLTWLNPVYQPTDSEVSPYATSHVRATVASQDNYKERSDMVDMKTYALPGYVGETGVTALWYIHSSLPIRHDILSRLQSLPLKLMLAVEHQIQVNTVFADHLRTSCACYVHV